MNRRGFTLIELLITVAIIGILAAIAIPAYIGQQKNAARTEAYTNLQNLSLLQAQHFADQGTYTVSLGTALKDHPGNVAIIQAGGSPADTANALPGFRPGSGLNFSYWIVTNMKIKDVNQVSRGNLAVGTGIEAQNPCFVAFAQGDTNGRVTGETFAIDCNNIKNF